MDDLSLFESLILGVVQGLTEFLPVSSDGHLVVARHLIDYQQDLLTFDVLLHFGTLGSIFVIFYKDALRLIQDWWKCALKPARFFEAEFRFSSFVFLTTLITGVLGLLFEDQVEQLFSSLFAAGVGFLITSVLLMLGSRHRFGTSQVKKLGLAFPMVVGFAQALAILPGVSRSGSTIATALLFGCSRAEAGRYSFVIAMPIIFMGSLYKSRELVGAEFQKMAVMFAGVATSFIVGIFAIRLLLWMLQKQNLYPFAIYTLILGALSMTYPFL